MIDESLALNSHAKVTNRLLPWLIWGISSLFVTFQLLLQTSPSVMIADLEKAFTIDTLGVSLLSTSFFFFLFLYYFTNSRRFVD